MRVRNQKIRTKFTRLSNEVINGRAIVKGLKLGGWLSGSPYLRIADQDDNYLAILEGAELYRLAKAIVRRFESK